MVGITSYNMHEMHDLAWEAVRKAEAATENALLQARRRTKHRKGLALCSRK